MPRPPGRRRRTRGLIVSHRGYRWHLFCAPLAFSARGSHTPLLHLGRYIASSAALWRLEMVRYRQPARLLSFVACLRAARLARESHFARRDEKERGAATGTRYTRTQQACARLYYSISLALQPRAPCVRTLKVVVVIWRCQKTASQRTVEQPVLYSSIKIRLFMMFSLHHTICLLRTFLLCF
jgi:hypothetical protein